MLGYLRDTQNYVHLAARGLTLLDVAPGRVERDLEQWKPHAALAATPDSRDRMSRRDRRAVDDKVLA